MSYDPSLTRGCPPPFYNAAGLPNNGGLLSGQSCIPAGSQYAALLGNITCCLPCPVSQWIYPNSLNILTDLAAWLNIISLILMFLLGLSYLLLPARFTGVHYLNTCMIISIIMFNLGFIVPHGQSSESCANPITPGDIYSSTTCAFSGAFIMAGGLCGSMWILVRSFSMHLQIVWNILPGNKFFYWTQLIGWLIPAAVFTAAITASGASYRFGPGACHVNHEHSMVSFWGWLIAIAAITVVVQSYTLIYCFHYYLRDLWADESQSASQEGGATHVFQRVKDVILLQWRGICMVLFLLIDVIFFTIIFVYLDNATNPNSKRAQQRSLMWGTCLITNPSHPEKCFALGQRFSVNEATLGAVLLMLSLLGIELWVLMFRWTIMSGWKWWFITKFTRRQALQPTNQPRQLDQDDMNYEMKQGGSEKKVYPFVDENPVGEISPISSSSASPDHRILMQQHFARRQQQQQQQQQNGLVYHDQQDHQHHYGVYAPQQPQQQQQMRYTNVAELPHGQQHHNKPPVGFL